MDIISEVPLMTHDAKQIQNYSIELNNSNYLPDKDDFISLSKKAINKYSANLNDDRESIIDLGKLIDKVDAMSEELRRQRKIIVDLEDEKAQLLEYRERLNDENTELKDELRRTNKMLVDMEYARKLEMEKLKSSFDEMDELLEKEKDAHRIEEDKLKRIISNLEIKYKETNDMNKKEEGHLEKLKKLKENEKKLQENINNLKKRESEAKFQCNRNKSVLLDLQNRNKELMNMMEKMGTENDRLKSLLETEQKKV